MSRIRDYPGEMDTPTAIDDATSEALLTGRTVAAEYEPLRQVLVACRDAAGQPVPPRGELAARLVAGGFLDPAGPERPAGARTERRGLAAAAIRRWRRIRMAIMSGVATAATKIVGASVAAKAGAGVAIALASISTAGAAGTLPEPVQNRFDTVVESVSGTETPAPEPADDNAEFGREVSEDAQAGGVDGGEIRERARQQGERHRPDQLPTPAAGRPTEPGKPAELPTPHGPPTEPAGSRPSPGPTTPEHPPRPSIPTRP